jgi:hypothetical protein
LEGIRGEVRRVILEKFLRNEDLITSKFKCPNLAGLVVGFYLILIP